MPTFPSLTGRSSGRQQGPRLRHCLGPCWCPSVAALLTAPLNFGVRLMQVLAKLIRGIAKWRFKTLGQANKSTYRMLSRYPEQKRDRHLMAIFGLLCLPLSYGLSIIEVPLLPEFLLVAAALQISLAALLPRKAFAWLQENVYLFL
jgi:hypothetical protein